MKTDGQIVAATLTGDKDLFAEIVCRYEPALMRVALTRLGRADWAEDVVQETFYWAYKCLGSYNAQYSFRTWLWTILLNQCNRHQKRQGRVPAVSPWTDHSSVDVARMENSPSEQVAPPEALLAKERDELLSRQLAALAEEEADALRLRFFGGLKFQEIADAMGCSLSCAKTRVRRGLTKISERIATTANSDPNAHAANSDAGEKSI